MKKEDLRITKTKRDLRFAIIDLLKDNQFEKITVSDICEKAMVNRMTFYKHFQDKYDLLDYTINFLIEDLLVKTTETIKPRNFYEDLVDFCVSLTKLIVEECYEQKQVFKALSVRDNGIVYEVIVKTIRKYIEMLVIELGKSRQPKYPIPTITSFMTGGVTHLLYYWLLHINEYNKDDFSKDSANFIKDLMQSGLFFENK